MNIEGNKIKSILLKNGNKLEAPVIISNTTHHVTFNDLIGMQNVPEYYAKGL